MAAPLHAKAPDLGTLQTFAIFANQTITADATSHVIGDVGLSPGTAIVGFSPDAVTGTIHVGDAAALQAAADLVVANADLAGRPCSATLTGSDLGGMILTSGVYCFAAGAGLTGALTLDAQNDPNALFVFRTGSTLVTASGATVGWTNGRSSQLFWQVGSAATFGTGSQFTGTVLAATSITIASGATISGGRVFAGSGAVTLDNAAIAAPAAVASAVPEPATWLFLLAGIGVVGGGMRHRRGGTRLSIA